MGAYLRLVRFPAVFTVLADSAMGYLFALGFLGGLDGSWVQNINWVTFSLVLLASVAFYWGGMALNDAADADRDALNRSNRPIPAGKISRLTAYRLAIALLLVGLTTAGYLDLSQRPLHAILFAGALAAAIVLYDCVLKFTFLAPLLMGACRALNILFAFAVGWSQVGAISLSEMQGNPVFIQEWAMLPQTAWAIAAAIGVYITGVTWFARFENPEETNSSWLNKSIALALIVGGVALLTPVFWSIPDPLRFSVFSLQPQRWYLLVSVLALMIGTRALQALLIGSRAAIGAVVGYALLTLIVLDGVTISLILGPYAAVAILALLAPAIICKQFTYID